MATLKKAETGASIRMYRMGELGDCFLLTLRHKTMIRHLLIDCGSFRNGNESKARMVEIAEDIRDYVAKAGKRLHVVVGTHQHNDHVSGFVHAKEIFEQMKVEQVWLSWLDNPRSKVASQIQQDHLGLRKALDHGVNELRKLSKEKLTNGANPLSLKKIDEHVELVGQLLGFFAAPALPSEGVRILKKIGENAVDYLNPGDLRTIPGIPKSEIKVHILGPPRDQELLYRKDPRKGESYDHKLRAMHSMAKHFVKAVENREDHSDKEEQDFPFNRTFKRYIDKKETFSDRLTKTQASYQAEENEWRNIDSDWLEQASRLALYMDTFTNNSSLVFAIELVKSEKVLLFAADAQTGNWLSWEKVKFEEEGATLHGLLERTSFYKVGHHGSHNSTLKNAMEKINSDDLVVMIPVDKNDPNIKKKDGWKMPASKLYQRLKEKSQFRVLRMDDGYAKGCEPKKTKDDTWKKAGRVVITDLYIEYHID